MQNERPLTPTLSPAAGERERLLAARRDSVNGEHFQSSANGFPLPIRWGEGQGEGRQQLNSDG